MQTRIISILLAGLLLAGCNKNEDPAPALVPQYATVAPPHMDYWHWERPEGWDKQYSLGLRIDNYLYIRYVDARGNTWITDPSQVEILLKDNNGNTLANVSNSVAIEMKQNPRQEWLRIRLAYPPPPAPLPERTFTGQGWKFTTAQTDHFFTTTFVRVKGPDGTYLREDMFSAQYEYTRQDYQYNGVWSGYAYPESLDRVSIGQNIVTFLNPEFDSEVYISSSI